MADIGLCTQKFELPLPMVSGGCLSFDLTATRTSCVTGKEIIISKDTLYLHGTPEEIHAFGQAIVKATQDLVRSRRTKAIRDALARDVRAHFNAKKEAPARVTEDDELRGEAP